MCFSAQASFAAAGVLAVISYLILQKKPTAKQIPLALLPAIFGLQQCFEGVLWLTAFNPAHQQIAHLAMYGFLFFAFLLWPVYVPFAILSLENVAAIKNKLYMLWGMGWLISTSLLGMMLSHGVSWSITCSHIAYVLQTPHAFPAWMVSWYVIVTVLPFFISSTKHMEKLGIVMVLSVAGSYYFYAAHFTSVWCFFSALLSSIVYFII